MAATSPRTGAKRALVALTVLAVGLGALLAG